nr:irregular chiasm C-roughest protein-like isoform X1 [Dermatophagoides farinae]
MKNKTTTTKPFDGSGHNRLHHINHYDDHDDILKLKLKFNKYKMAKTTTIHPHNQCIRFISSSSSSTTTIFITDDDAKHQQNQNLNHFHHYCHNCSQYTNHCHQCRKVKSKNSYHHHHLSSQHNQYLPLIYWTLFIITIIFNPLSATSTTANMTSSIRRSGRLPPQRFEMEPIDKTSIVGDTIILPCRVANKVGTLQWTRDGFGLGTERTLEGFQRYRMIGSDDEGDYSLEISPVTLEDDAVFQCQVGAIEGGVSGIRSRSARFTVQVPPESPVIIVTHAHSHAQVYKSSSSSTTNDEQVDSSMFTVSSTSFESSSDDQSINNNQKSTMNDNDHNLRTTAGMTIELTCEAHGGRPPAELTWMDSNGNPITNGVSYSTTKLPDGKRWNAALKWTVVASRSLDGQRVTCRSENAALKSPRYAHIQLEVRYPPEVELRIASLDDDNDGGGGLVREGDDLTLECLAIGNPSLMTFKWSRDGVPLNSDGDITGAGGGGSGVASSAATASGDGTPRLIFRRIGREFHGTNIACEVANSVGTTRVRIEIKVAFKPRFSKLPEPVIGLAKNEHVRLNCNIDSYPPARIYWYRFMPKLSSIDDHYFDDNNWQSINNGVGDNEQSIQISEAGRYRCMAKNNAFDVELKAETLVFIKGAPLIRSPSIQYGIENEPVRLQCIVEAVPPPTKITWFKLQPYQQLLGVDNNEGYEILEEEDPDDYSMFQSSPSYLTSSSSSLAMIQSSQTINGGGW